MRSLRRSRSSLDFDGTDMNQDVNAPTRSVLSDSDATGASEAIEPDMYVLSPDLPPRRSEASPTKS